MPLLIPRLHAPRMSSSVILRERLFSLLDSGVERKLTLIAAPAGSGKTTLIRSWIASRGTSIPPVAWLTLENSDNDPSRFLRYLIAACQTLQQAPGSTTLSLLPVSHPLSFQSFSLEAALTSLLNDLSCLAKGGILVLDDYHVITVPEIHRAMNFFLEHLPESLHLILLARGTPPLSLARLRAHDDLVELNAIKLRFSTEETRAFFQQTLPFLPDDAAINQIQTRTEGWAAGLRLIALALQGQEQISSEEIERLLTTISGSQRHILEYLVTEVLEAQPEPLQTFLLQTTGLSRLNSSLCDMVTERNDSAILLAQIERADLFLLPLNTDDSGQWYRYHALFAEAMQHEAHHRLGKEAIRSLARKASHWYEQHAMFDDAIESALTAGDTDRVAGLITYFVESRSYYQFNEFYTLSRWLQRLPEETLQRSPTLCQGYALALLFSTEQHTPALRTHLERYLRLAEESLRATNNLQKLGEVLALRALAAGQLNDQETSISSAQQALTLLPADKKDWRSTCLLIIGMHKMVCGRLKDAQQATRAAQALMKDSGNSYSMRAVQIVMGMINLGQGKLHQATEILQQILNTVGKDRFDRVATLIGLAILSYERNQLVTAEKEAREAYDLSRELRNEALQLQATTILARVLHAQGETTQAQELLQRLTVHLTQPQWQHEIEIWQIWFAYASGDTAPLQERISAQPANTSEEILTEAQREREALLFARLLIDQRRIQEALTILAHWRRQAHDQLRIRSELEILLLTARAYFIAHRTQEAQQIIKEALALARPADYLRPFLDEGEQMAALLKAILPTVREKPLAAFLRKLLLSFTPEQGTSPAAAPLDGQLSPQERRVLRLLVAGRTNPEIARELVVSVNTIKAQVKSIYRKLDVSSRREASEVARHLHLL